MHVKLKFKDGSLIKRNDVEHCSEPFGEYKKLPAFELVGKQFRECFPKAWLLSYQIDGLPERPIMQ